MRHEFVYGWKYKHIAVNFSNSTDIVNKSNIIYILLPKSVYASLYQENKIEKDINTVQAHRFSIFLTAFLA